MKFKKLIGKFEKYADKHEKGKEVEPSKIEQLRQLLADKKDRYEKKLGATEDADKRKKLETRLRVVEAQLQKSNRLLE